MHYVCVFRLENARCVLILQRKCNLLYISLSDSLIPERKDVEKYRVVHMNFFEIFGEILVWDDHLCMFVVCSFLELVVSRNSFFYDMVLLLGSFVLFIDEY